MFGSDSNQNCQISATEIEVRPRLQHMLWIMKIQDLSTYLKTKLSRKLISLPPSWILGSVQCDPGFAQMLYFSVFLYPKFLVL